MQAPEQNISGSLFTFTYGKFWKNHPLNDTPTIILRLYGDDFESANPLGFHHTIYKVGYIYYQLENLPQFIQS